VSWACKFRGLHANAACECTPSGKTLCVVGKPSNQPHILRNMAHRTHEVLYLTILLQTTLRYWPIMSFMYVIHLHEYVFVDRVWNRKPTGVTHYTAYQATCLDVNVEGPVEARLQYGNSAVLAWCIPLQLGSKTKSPEPYIHTHLICCFSEQKMQNDCLFLLPT